MNWPKLIKSYRATYELTQQRLADELNTPKRTVQNWEGGVNVPPNYLELALKYLSMTNRGEK